MMENPSVVRDATQTLALGLALHTTLHIVHICMRCYTTRHGNLVYASTWVDWFQCYDIDVPSVTFADGREIYVDLVVAADGWPTLRAYIVHCH
jgi:hypothetical protein